MSISIFKILEVVFQVIIMQGTPSISDVSGGIGSHLEFSDRAWKPEVTGQR